MFKQNRLNVAVLTALAAVVAPGAYAQLDETSVTATQREQSIQEIPVVVQALGSEDLDRSGVGNFTDYLKQFPSLSAGGSGPGRNSLFIRGVASSTPELATAGVAGLATSVGFYLDEQPLNQPGRNLDVYAADLSRMELLVGPQSTLFGAGSQAGTVRMVTNKPTLDGIESRIKVGANALSEGSDSNSIEAMLNMPFSDRFAVRGVVYRDERGGWIDNVAGSISLSDSPRFAEGGQQAGANLDQVTFNELSNQALEEKDYNGSLYTGGRFSVLYQFNPDWRLDVAYNRQRVETDGVFFADPEKDDYAISRFSDEFLDDEFTSTSWTLQGRFGDLQALYTGAYTNRKAKQQLDYSDYAFVSQDLPYYLCDTGVIEPSQSQQPVTEGTPTGPGGGSGNPSGTCYAPEMFVGSRSETRFETHEVRFITDLSLPLRGTFGASYSDTVLEELNDFNYPNSAEINSGAGFVANRAFTTGHVSTLDAFPRGVISRNDIRRTNQEFGLYGQLEWDINDLFTMTTGLRYYDVEVDLAGSANSSRCNASNAAGDNSDANAFGSNISDIYNGDGEYTFIDACPGSVSYAGRTFTADDLANLGSIVSDERHSRLIRGALGAPDSATWDGILGNWSLAYTPNADMMLYVAWSQGFRPGLLNQAGGHSNQSGFSVPFKVNKEDITNYELGWKLEFLNNSLRVNGSLFSMEITDLQTTVYDSSIVSLRFSENAADASVKGFEGDFVYAPAAVSGLTVSGAFSLLNSEVDKTISNSGYVSEGDDLAFAPQFQSNLQASYEWYVGEGMTAYVTPRMTYSKSAYSDVVNLSRDKIDSWMLLGLSLGVVADEWVAEMYVDNLADTEAELSRSYFYQQPRATYARPRTVGVRVIYDF